MTDTDDLSQLTGAELDEWDAAEAARVEAMSEEEYEIWQCWERCWYCPRKLESVAMSAAGVCEQCQAHGRVFPVRRRLTAEQVRAQLIGLIEREKAQKGEQS
jgi:hypothetical protein